jgi:hypothetical protein
LNVRPLLCLAAYNNAVKEALHAVNQLVAAKNPAWTIMAAPAVRINLAEDLAGAPPDVMEFGCEAAVDAYTGRPTIVTINAMEHPWRYAGGHMHMSSPGAYLLGPTYAAHDIGAHWEPIREAARRRTLGNKENYPLFVKMMDLYVGIPDTYIFSSPAMFRRRRYYGGAGEFRYKTYPGGTIGVEYRTPSPMM